MTAPWVCRAPIPGSPYLCGGLMHVTPTGYRCPRCGAIKPHKEDPRDRRPTHPGR